MRKKYSYTIEYFKINGLVSGGKCYLNLLKGFIGRNGFLLQQKSSAAGFQMELWKNDIGDDLSVALAQYSMYPLIFLAVLLHDHQSCFLQNLSYQYQPLYLAGPCCSHYLTGSGSKANQNLGYERPLAVTIMNLSSFHPETSHAPDSFDSVISSTAGCDTHNDSIPLPRKRNHTSGSDEYFFSLSGKLIVSQTNRLDVCIREHTDGSL